MNQTRLYRHAAAFAAAIASLKEQSALHVPSFVSAVLVTVKVAAWADKNEKIINRVIIAKRPAIERKKLMVFIEFYS